LEDDDGEKDLARLVFEEVGKFSRYKDVMEEGDYDATVVSSSFLSLAANHYIVFLTPPCHYDSGS